MINVAVLGYGTVGSGVVEVIETNKEVIDKRAGEELHVKYILDLRDFPGDPYEDRVVHDYSIILNDPEVSIICETMGGNEPAFTFSMQALKAGKSVCTLSGFSKSEAILASSLLQDMPTFTVKPKELRMLSFIRRAAATGDSYRWEIPVNSI